MAYDSALADRFRTVLAGVEGIGEKRMMGGLCFFLNGNMIGGVDRTKDGRPRFMFRTGKGNHAAARLPGAEPMIQGGRVMSGMFFANADHCDDELLKQWLDIALSHARKLSPK